MIEDLERAEFNGIVSASFGMDERKLLRRIASKSFRLLPYAEQWAFDNVPAYVLEPEFPVPLRVELIATGIEGYFDFHYCNLHLQELMLTEADNGQAPQESNREHPGQGGSEHCS